LLLFLGIKKGRRSDPTVEIYGVSRKRLQLVTVITYLFDAPAKVVSKGSLLSGIFPNTRMSKIETIFGTGLVNLTCPECSTRMRIYLIMPDGPGRDRRIYICDCGWCTSGNE
jgi:hypothetical protein